MLSLYEEHKQKFDSASFKNKNVWRLIAEEMAHKGVTVTGEACDSKFRLMKLKYKKIVDQHAPSGSGRKNWEYFQWMDELFAGDPSVRPAMVVSSMPVQQDVTVTVTAKPPPGPRRPTVHKATTPPPIDQPAGRATTPSTEGTDELVATPLIRKRKRSGSQDPQEWFRSYMLELCKDLTAWMPITSV
ncbi:hypothetical protein DPMN_071695 [Dreissena polymorpha]|uniref:Myb/SANT-like DNA-binding domain-containing protein n=2 Tax=Dreissena polymorpha TaxID=45954 RepID=A0A9D3Z3F1_DREPO|nr:hypothetical protein DPMN_071695 [Dreissena polymorpha]